MTRRAAVGIGQSRGIFNAAPPSADPTARRQLSSTQSLPSLPFGRPTAPIFASGLETLETVFNSGGSRRDHELKPFWAAGSPSTSSREASGVFSVASDGFRTRGTTADTMEEGDGDGFDMDEVFAPVNLAFNPRALNFDNAADFDDPAPEPQQEQESQESQSSSGTATTITARLKRSHTDDEPQAAEDDYDMAKTDEEDEEDDEILPLALHAPIGRPIAGRRGLSKTQSLPASVFSSTEF